MIPGTRVACGIALLVLIEGCSSGAPDVGQSKMTPSPGRDADAGAQAADALDADLDAPIRSGSDDAAPSSPGDGASPEGGPSTAHGMLAGVNVHNYPAPDAYGFTAADGGTDRMGTALLSLGDTAVRGATIGDTTFITRLGGFGVKDVVAGASATAYGKPFDAAKLATALQASLAAAKSAGVTLYVEGLNEWDLFNTKSYNAGAVPAGTTESAFVLLTQKALYEAAHPLGLTVLGPSVGHPSDATNLAFFPDVSAYLDVVNAHIYFTSSPETLPLAQLVANHQNFEGAGKPLWVTETGISSYGSVTTQDQADVIGRGLAVFGTSKLIARAFVYELLDEYVVGVNGGTYEADSDQIHFGLFDSLAAEKPAAGPMRDFIRASMSP